MSKITIISVGRIKTPFWREAAEHYRKRLENGNQIREIRVKDADPSLPPAKKNAQEGARILEALPAGHEYICLDEKGKQMESKQLAALLETLSARSRPPCFIIGGAYGLSAEVLAAAHKKLSLSDMTFPHELAQVILLEQLFRADSILRKSGYHHE